MRKAPIVIVVGAGLSGLTCAVKLHEQGVPVLVTEAGDRLGGRAGSDRHQEFILDRGFQSMLSAYPSVKKTLDLPALNLQPYYPGVQIWHKGKFNKFVLPVTKNPLEALTSLQASIGTLNDKTNMLKFRTRLMAETQDAIMKKPNRTTLEFLKAEGFSEISSIISGAPCAPSCSWKESWRRRAACSSSSCTAIFPGKQLYP